MKGWTTQDFAQSEAAKKPENAHLLPDAGKKVRKKAKYNNQKVIYDGMTFDSKKEYKRYRELLIMVKLAEITMPERQVRYLLIEANETEKKCEYWADFRYKIQATGETVVEDVKSEMTRKLSTYVMKRKLMKSVHGISIKEV